MSVKSKASVSISFCLLLFIVSRNCQVCKQLTMWYPHFGLICTWNNVAKGRGGFCLHLSQDDTHVCTSTLICGQYTPKYFSLLNVCSFEKWTLPTAIYAHIGGSNVDCQVLCISLESCQFVICTIYLPIEHIVLFLQLFEVVAHVCFQ